MEEIPLMVLDGDVATVAVPPDVRVRLLSPSDAPAIADAGAVTGVAFGAAGTARGAEGPAERDARRKPAQQHVVDLIAEGAVRVAVAETKADGVVATGRTLPLAGVAEVAGVAALPAARRQGLGAAVTAALVADAREISVSTVFLTAGSEDVARVYSRIGFTRVGTGYAAERRAP